ncbi:MAG TPA: helix-turn-helix transcriptional regulator [Clostridiaceae bacterium]|nr:helix-turn-helix transcriptional regulator [Clostridiaceae bacterium]
MDFNDLFCRLVDMTDSTITDIARIIAYDRSYISKWYNGKALPSAEVWDEISPQLADYFSEKMSEEHFTELAINNPRIKTERTTASDRQLLKSLLDDAFNTSYLDTYPKEYFFNASNISLMLNGPDEFISFMFDVIDKAATSAEVTKDIYFQGDVFNALTPERIDALKFPYTSNNNFRLHFVTDSSLLKNYRNESIKKIHKFFRLTSQLSFLEFIPYIRDDVQDFQCALDEVFYLYGTVVSPDNDFKIFITHNPHIFEKGKRKLEEYFSNIPPLIELEPSTDKFLQWANQEQTENKGFFYLPALPLYWAGQDLRERLYAKKLISRLDYEVWQDISDLSQGEIIQKAVILIPEFGIERVMQEGVVRTSEGFLRLNDQDRLAYNAEIRIMLEERKAKGIFYMIPNQIQNSDRLPLNGIYSDGVTAFYLQTNQINAFVTGQFFYKINDLALSDIVYRYLGELRFIENNNFVL